MLDPITRDTAAEGDTVVYQDGDGNIMRVEVLTPPQDDVSDWMVTTWMSTFYANPMHLYTMGPEDVEEIGSLEDSCNKALKKLKRAEQALKDLNGNVSSADEMEKAKRDVGAATAALFKVQGRADKAMIRMLTTNPPH